MANLFRLERTVTISPSARAKVEYSSLATVYISRSSVLTLTTETSPLNASPANPPA